MATRCMASDRRAARRGVDGPSMSCVPYVIGVLLVIPACHLGHPSAAALEGGIRLRADSAQYSLREDGPMYLATIGFQLENNSGRTLSQNYCDGPSPSSLEKQRPNGDWVWAWGGIELTCRRFPPFRIASGETYRGAFLATAPRPGANVFPTSGPEFVPGVYRLRWELRASADPDDGAAPIISAVSLPFRLVLQ